MESSRTLGIKAVLVFICKLCNPLPTATTAVHHPPPQPPVLVLPDRTKPRLPGWTAGSSLSPPSHLFADDFFNLYNPGKADCAQVPPAGTSMRHFPPPQRWSSVSGAIQQGFCQRRPTRSSLTPCYAPFIDFVCLFFYCNLWKSSSLSKINNLWLSESCFFSRNQFFLSSSTSILLYFTALPLTDAAALLSNGLQETAGASRLHLLTVCVFTLLVFTFCFLFFYSLGPCVSTAGESSCGITQQLMTQFSF